MAGVAEKVAQIGVAIVPASTASTAAAAARGARWKLGRPVGGRVERDITGKSSVMDSSRPHPGVAAHTALVNQQFTVRTPAVHIFKRTYQRDANMCSIKAGSSRLDRAGRSNVHTLVRSVWVAR